MNKEVLKRIIINQRESLEKNLKNYTHREIEKKIFKGKKNNFVIIISGIRRAGKSTLLEYIRQNQAEQDFYLNFDDDRLVNFTVDDFQVLIEVFFELYGEQKTFYFDEIQNIPAWERFVRRLHNEGNKVYITGSNASMLSRELGTHLTGRYLEWSLYPFSFAEFLEFKKFDLKKESFFLTRERAKIVKLFNEYFKNGGLPEYLQTQKVESLKLLYNNILYRDIITRYNLPKEKPIKELVHFCASNIGKEISFNSLKKTIGLHSSTSVKEYFEYLENSYLTFLLPKHSFSLKKQLVANKKVYFIDNALAGVVGFRFSEDKGRFLENVVFIELKRRQKTLDELYYFSEKGECDFVIRKGRKIVEAIQVTEHLDEHNKEREIDGLVEALKKFNLKSGLILTNDEENQFQKNGKKIKVMPVWKWLLK